MEGQPEGAFTEFTNRLLKFEAEGPILSRWVYNLDPDEDQDDHVGSDGSSPERLTCGSIEGLDNDDWEDEEESAAGDLVLSTEVENSKLSQQLGKKGGHQIALSKMVVELVKDDPESPRLRGDALISTPLQSHGLLKPAVRQWLENMIVDHQSQESWKEEDAQELWNLGIFKERSLGASSTVSLDFFC